MIPLSKPSITARELENVKEVFSNNKLSGDGDFTKKCEAFLQERYNCKRALLTSSCTAALEMCALLLNIEPGDEVIVPSFTFVTTASAFVLRGAKIVFCDSLPNHPNMDAGLLENLISNKTKVIVPVHYGGVPCDMDKIMEIATRNNVFVIEDAAQAIESSYNGKQLGTIGHMGAFSFHDTKNITSGEGGALLINDENLVSRSEIIREKGTNRKSFFRGEVDKYGWVDLGSSYIMSELNAAILYSQLERIEEISKKRIAIWNKYEDFFSSFQSSLLDDEYQSEIGSAHLYTIRFNSIEIRNIFVKSLKEKGITSTFHFLPLEKSEYITSLNSSAELCNNSQLISDSILRLPFYTDLTNEEFEEVISTIKEELIKLNEVA